MDPASCDKAGPPAGTHPGRRPISVTVPAARVVTASVGRHARVGEQDDHAADAGAEGDGAPVDPGVDLLDDGGLAVAPSGSTATAWSTAAALSPLRLPWSSAGRATAAGAASAAVARTTGRDADDVGSGHGGSVREPGRRARSRRVCAPLPPLGSDADPATMHLHLLGPVEARLDGRTLQLGPPKQRAVLAMLALRPGRTVSVDRLAEGLWGELPPPARRR